MSLGWKVLLPLATLNVLVTAVLVVVCDVCSIRAQQRKGTTEGGAST